MLVATVKDWLINSEKRLTSAGIATARLDCLVLLEDATGKDRGWLLAHPEHELQGSEIKNLSTKIAQRAKHVPLAYIRGKAEFYGREFAVNAHTLVPRPETEAMIELLNVVCNRESAILSWQEPTKSKNTQQKRDLSTSTKKASTLVRTDGGYKVVWQPPQHNTRPKRIRDGVDSRLRGNDKDMFIIDIGTGSGAIAITAKLEHPDATVIATDIDQKCLETARQNAQSLSADIAFFNGNLLEPLLQVPKSNIQVLLCNLPYVLDNFQINTAATHEPRHALFGGPDGLDLYRELFKQIQTHKLKPAYILTESLPPQHGTLTQIAKSANYKLTKTDDFIQLFKPNT
jgi:methylase of polypeptide subunit release factors